MRLLLALLAGGLVAGCTTLEDGTPEDGETAPSEPPAAPARDATGAEPPRVPYEFHTVVADTGYEHIRLDAATQATIVWRNAGLATHSVVSDDGTFAGSGPIPPGGEFRFTFLVPGDYAYHCRYHPEMAGLVVVR